MPTSRNIHFDVIPLINRHWQGNVQELAKLLADHLIGEFDSGAFIGQEGGPEPNTNIGAWLNQNVWLAWNETAGKYLPFPMISGNLVSGAVKYTILIPTATTTPVMLYLPDKDGKTLATLDDIHAAQGLNDTETHSGSTITLDLSNKNVFYVTLTGNVTVNRTGALKDGQTVEIYFQTPPGVGPYTITWNPSDFYGISSGSLSAADSSHFSITRVKAHVVGSSVYVEYDETFSVAITKDVTGPQAISVDSNASENTISITFNELVKAATLSISGWNVTKNGNNNLVTGAVAIGSKVVLTVASNYKADDIGSVSYSGTDLQDVSGNVAPAFGSSSISIHDATVTTSPDPATVNLVTGI